MQGPGDEADEASLRPTGTEGAGRWAPPASRLRASGVTAGTGVAASGPLGSTPRGFAQVHWPFQVGVADARDHEETELPAPGDPEMDAKPGRTIPQACASAQLTRAAAYPCEHTAGGRVSARVRNSPQSSGVSESAAVSGERGATCVWGHRRESSPAPAHQLRVLRLQVQDRAGTNTQPCPPGSPLQLRETELAKPDPPCRPRSRWRLAPAGRGRHTGRSPGDAAQRIAGLQARGGRGPDAAEAPPARRTAPSAQTAHESTPQ